MVLEYYEFILEKEFSLILSDMSMILESGAQQTGQREWEWNLEGQTTGLDKNLARLKKFLAPLGKIKIKKYYIKLVNRLKTLPAKLRKFLLTHYTSVFLALVSLSWLTSTTETQTEAPQPVVVLDPQIKGEIIEIHRRSSFEGAQAIVKEVEGGYSDDPQDRGNFIQVGGGGSRFVGTNHGISAPTLQQHLGRMPKKEDMMGLSYQSAREIYKNLYWDAQNLSRLSDQSVANIIYDGCVNQGVSGMSSVINLAAAEQDLQLSGSVWSEGNLKQLNTLDQQSLFNSLKKYRLLRYRNSGTWEVHGRGWSARLAAIEYKTLNK